MTETNLAAGPGNERQWAMFCHLAALSGYLIPFGNIIGPLIVWQMKKQEYPLVDEHGKASLNFQISGLIYFLVFFVTIVLIPVALLIALAILVLTIIAGVKAANGVPFKYPGAIRFIK